MAREGHKLRSIDQQKATLERLVYPRLGQRPIGDIRRSEIVRLMDEIEDQRGAAMAGVTLQIIRKVLNWHATRDDTFHSPIVKGMSRGKSKARQRVLSDDELRKVWAASSNGSGVFGRLVRFLLLTATRRNEAAQMHRSELHGSDWIIPSERYKTNLPHLIPLSPAALALLPAEGEWLFTAYGTGPVRGFSGLKTSFDTACAVTGWTLHDLRRTARTLMSTVLAYRQIMPNAAWATFSAPFGERMTSTNMPSKNGKHSRRWLDRWIGSSIRERTWCR
jgi:integrase